MLSSESSARYVVGLGDGYGDKGTLGEDTEALGLRQEGRGRTSRTAMGMDGRAQPTKPGAIAAYCNWTRTKGEEELNTRRRRRGALGVLRR